MAYKIGGLVKKQMEALEANHNLQMAGFDEQSRKGYILLPKYILDLNISISAKLLYCVLLDYAWGNNYCFAGQEKLSERMHLGTRQVQHLIDELKKAGLVGIKRRGLGKTNLYVLYAKSKAV